MTATPIICQTCAICLRAILPANKRARVQADYSDMQPNAVLHFTICEKCGEDAEQGAVVVANVINNRGDKMIKINFSKQ